MPPEMVNESGSGLIRGSRYEILGAGNAEGFYGVVIVRKAER